MSIQPSCWCENLPGVNVRKILKKMWGKQINPLTYTPLIGEWSKAMFPGRIFCVLLYIVAYPSLSGCQPSMHPSFQATIVYTLSRSQIRPLLPKSRSPSLFTATHQSSVYTLNNVHDIGLWYILVHFIAYKLAFPHYCHSDACLDAQIAAVHTAIFTCFTS